MKKNDFVNKYYFYLAVLTMNESVLVAKNNKPKALKQNLSGVVHGNKAGLFDPNMIKKQFGISNVVGWETHLMIQDFKLISKQQFDVINNFNLSQSTSNKIMD